jgi:hypothetical protein
MIVPVQDTNLVVVIQSATVWSAVQDGIVIRVKMNDDQVWTRCQILGGPVLIEALENFISGTDVNVWVLKI